MQQSRVGQLSTIDPQLSRDALAKFIIDADLPINLGEHPGYQEFVWTFYPQYQNVSRKTTRNDIMAYYNRGRGALMEEIKKGTFNVALTSDVLSGHTRKDYVSVVL